MNLYLNNSATIKLLLHQSVYKKNSNSYLLINCETKLRAYLLSSLYILAINKFVVKLAFNNYPIKFHTEQ